MFNRIFIALILIPVVFVAVYLGYIPFLIFICGICFLAAFEFWLLVLKMGFVPRKTFGNISILLILISIFFNGSKIASVVSNEATAMIFTLVILLLFVYEIIRYDIRTAIPSLAITFLGIIYLGWLPGHFLLIRDFRPDGFKFTALLLITVWIADSAAYFFGSAYGSRRLSLISPKKSVEGAIASVFASIITVFFAKLFFMNFLRPANVFSLGVLISISAQFGDLAESLIKRSAGVKDSSGMLKDHGGILDKLDSFIFAAPVFYYYIKFFVI
ncbi:MAG: phosphatidate cytidylyltransferase [Elusimicrobia bacterium]|nr:phosphatidate cytidylyltransferase [Elusimicrobiota bacterium]